MAKSFEQQMNEDCGYAVTPGYEEPPEFESFSMTADQQIRTKALEAALQYRAIFKRDLEERGFACNDKFCDRVFTEKLVEFETYIREGK